jgi:hypothetical protein
VWTLRITGGPLYSIGQSGVATARWDYGEPLAFQNKLEI